MGNLGLKLASKEPLKTKTTLQLGLEVLLKREELHNPGLVQFLIPSNTGNNIKFDFIKQRSTIPKCEQRKCYDIAWFW